jgi:apolipoprotein N-acyltransferase
LALLGGGIGALAFEPALFGWGWIFVFPCWGLLLWAVRGAGVRRGAKCGLVFGMALYGLSLTWLWSIFGWLAVAMWMLLAVFSGVAGGIGGWLSQRAEGARWMPVAVAAAWTGVEFYRCEWFLLRFPWITPGMGLGPCWLSPIAGIYGVGFLVVLGMALVVLGRRVKGVEAGVLAFLLLLGVWRPGPVDGLRPEDKVPVMLVQSESCRFDRYLAMSRASGFRNGLVVWPEYAVPYDIEESDDGELPRLAMWVSQADVVAVIGTLEDLEEGHHNSALTVDDTGPLGRHAKCRTVHFMNDGRPGEVMEPIETRWGKVATPICFDGDFTRVARRMTAAGAEWFAMPSMDPEPWGARQHWQHAELFRHRALENGRWFAVASSSGATRFVDPHGVVRSELPLMEEGVLTGEVWRRDKLTFFTRAGWLTPWVLGGIAVAGIVAGFRAGRQGPFCSRPPARPRSAGQF